MKDVHCPPLLLAKLKKLWQKAKGNSQYRVISEVIESLDVPNDKSVESINIQNVLYDTFYRYLVLFDLDIGTSLSSSPMSLEDHDDESAGDSGYPYPRTNPVLRDTMECLGLDTTHAKGGPKKPKREECIRQFQDDRSQWSLHFGSHPVMKRVRENLSLLGEGALDLLCGMVHLDASKRCSMHEALTSPLFHPMRKSAATEHNHDHDQTDGRSFMHYKNKQFLPIF